MHELSSENKQSKMQRHFLVLMGFVKVWYRNLAAKFHKGKWLGTKGYFCIRKTFSEPFFDMMNFYYVAYVFFSIIFHNYFSFRELESPSSPRMLKTGKEACFRLVRKFMLIDSLKMFQLQYYTV